MIATYPVTGISHNAAMQAIKCHPIANNYKLASIVGHEYNYKVSSSMIMHVK